MTDGRATTLMVLIPLFNDWVAVQRLLSDLDAEFARVGRSATVLIVDDGSTEPVAGDSEIVAATPRRLNELYILHLRRNLGTQRAIAIGLAWAEANLNWDCVVIMDGDGEDLPSDVPRLIDEFERAGGNTVVFAERTRRSEGSYFVVMYALYRALHLVLTGERVRVGNFSIIPGPLVKRLVAVSDLWNHYAAAVFKSRIPYRTVGTSRGTRYSGRSHMNHVALITHGLSAMSVFGDRIGVRLLAATSGIAILMVAAMAITVGLQLATGAAVPSWAPYALLLAALALFQVLIACLTFVFIILSARDTSTFIPLRDYIYFVAEVRLVSAASHHVVSVPR
jgi:polyisoprenyl-phosphate glycosyltransferase